MIVTVHNGMNVLPAGIFAPCGVVHVWCGRDASMTRQLPNACTYMDLWISYDKDKSFSCARWGG